ncbi:MAG: hypothetical protein HYX74_09875 [Acidobacteria bacterium]|nr:hypothetical protein [Acidobacteriota bacterium]
MGQGRGPPSGNAPLYTQLIARRVREAGVYSEIHPYNRPLEAFKGKNVKGFILSGGPDSVFQPNALKGDPGLLSDSKPVLGICYGLQWMAQQRGGSGARAKARIRTGVSETEGRKSSVCLPAGRIPGLDEPWGPRGDPAGRFPDSGHGPDHICNPTPSASALRHPVSSRGCAHRARRQDSGKFSLWNLSLLGRLEHGIVCRSGGSEDPDATV